MIQTGYLNEEYARKYPEYSYRVPLMPPINIRSLDPDRVYPDREYPRWTAKPPMVSAPYRTTAKYKVVIKSAKEGEYLEELEVWLKPSEYSQATQNKLILREKVAFSNLHYKEYIREAMYRAFK